MGRGRGRGCDGQGRGKGIRITSVKSRNTALMLNRYVNRIAFVSSPPTNPSNHSSVICSSFLANLVTTTIPHQSKPYSFASYYILLPQQPSPPIGTPSPIEDTRLHDLTS